MEEEMPTDFSAGYAGPKVKSDCLVIFAPGEGALEVSISGEADHAPLEAAVRAVADRIGVNGRVTVEDSGALPFVAAARFEAAARKATGGSLTPLPPAAVFQPSPRVRPRRSRLYLPGNRPEFLPKAVSSGADGVILDLEDSVSPDRKFEARILVAHALASMDFGGVEIMVRINQGAGGDEDLAWIIPQRVQHVLVPKVETPSRISEVRALSERIAKRCHRPGLPWFMPIIESPLGILSALDIARAVPETAALTLGLQDLTAELGVRPTPGGRESFFSRSMIVLAARAAGLQPIDTVYADVKNEEGLRASIAEARELGFIGKGCVHPGQVAAINQGFMPDAESIEYAKKVVLAMEDAQSRGLGAVALGSKMIDPAVARQAEATVSEAVMFGMIPEGWRDAAGTGE